MNQLPPGIDADTVATLRKWAEQHEFVRRMWLFGSRARGDHRDDSDIDVALDIDPDPTSANAYASFMFLHKGWEDELNSLVAGPRVHLCHYNDNPDLPEENNIRSDVDREGIRLYPIPSDQAP